MSGVIGVIKGIFSTDTVEWSKGTKTASNDIDAVDKKAKTFLQNLANGYGKKSTLGQLTKLAVGGGAIAGLSFAAKELDQFTAKILEMSMASDKADKSFDDYAVGFAKALPIVGSLVDAVENIMKVVTGQAKAEAEIKAIFDDQTAAIAKRNEFIKKGAEEEEKLADGLRKAQQERILNQTQEGSARDTKKAQFETGDKLHDLDKDFAKNSGLEEMKAIQAQIAALKGKQDERSVREAENLNTELSALQKSYNKQWQLWQYQRGEIAAAGAAKIQDIQFEAVQKQLKTQQEAKDKELKAFEELQKQKEEAQQKTLQRLDEMGREVTEKNDPLQKYFEDIKQLDTLFAAGTITAKTYDTAAKKALGSYDEAAGGKQEGYKAATSHIRRSAETVIANPRIASPLNDINKKAAEALAEHRKANGYLKDIAAGSLTEVSVNF